MSNDSSDINRASLNSANKVEKSTYICVCVYITKKKNIEVEPSMIVLHKNTIYTHTHTGKIR